MSQEEQLGKNSQINFVLLKQMLSEDKKISRVWLKNTILTFINIAKT
jgi:hypothetical protein